jgi:hypothetical protein
MPVQHLDERSFAKASQLSSWQVAKMIPPLDVIRILNAAKVSFVLVGAYGLVGWTKEPRATEDVDVVVAAKQVKRAIRSLCAAYPDLEPVDLPVVVRLRNREAKEVAIDIMKPVQPPYREVFKHTQIVHSEGQRYRVPSLEMAIVMKYSAMSSMYRAEEDKFQDAHDFILLVKKNPAFDKERLSVLGSLLYPDGGKDVVEMARKALAGEMLIL